MIGISRVYTDKGKRQELTLTMQAQIASSSATMHSPHIVLTSTQGVARPDARRGGQPVIRGMVFAGGREAHRRDDRPAPTAVEYYCVENGARVLFYGKQTPDQNYYTIVHVLHKQISNKHIDRVMESVGRTVGALTRINAHTR